MVPWDLFRNYSGRIFFLLLIFMGTDVSIIRRMGISRACTWVIGCVTATLLTGRVVAGLLPHLPAGRAMGFKTRALCNRTS